MSQRQQRIQHVFRLENESSSRLLFVDVFVDDFKYLEVALISIFQIQDGEQEKWKL